MGLKSYSGTAKAASASGLMLFVIGLVVAQLPPVRGEDCEIASPCWYAMADGVWLRRDEGQSVFLVEAHNAGFPRTLSAGITSHSVEFDYEPGFRVLFGRRFNECDAVEFSYLGTHDWNEFASATSDPFVNPLRSPLLPLTNNGVIAQVVRRVDANFSSELHSAELVAKRDIFDSTATILAGVRYVNFEDDVVLTSYNDVNAMTPVERGSIDTSNHLIGLEMGAERSVGWRRASLNLFGKAGLFLNFTNQKMQDNSVGAPPPGPLAPNPIINTDQDSISFAGMIDAGVTAKVHITDHLFIRGGYQVMILSGMALAPDQITLLGSAGFPARVTNADLPRSVNDNGVLVLDGFFAGFGAEW